MEKKYQVFISSTYKDLIEEREKVRDVILSMYHFPIGMEMFNAADEEQWEIIRETIDSSDYYILIIGKRYGSIIPDGKPDAGMSYTEKEYRYARENGIPIMAFIKRDTAITSDKMDLEPEKIAKLKAFVSEITDTRETDWFEDANELGTKVSLALHKQMDRKKRPGWVRGDRFDLDASLSELVALSKQVRELSEENNRLKASSALRTPALNVSIQFAGTIDEPFEPDDDAANEDPSSASEEALPVAEIVERFQVPEKIYLDYENPITLNDIPSGERTLVTQEIIDIYNSRLPNKKTVDSYNEDMRYYNEVRKNGQLLNFIIRNDGTAKATDINITLEFPKAFILMKRKDAERLTEPKKPPMPDRPVEIAISQNIIDGPIKRLLRSESTLTSLTTEPFSSKNVLSAVLENTGSKDWDVSIVGQKVELWKRSLLHTYAWVVDDLCIVPTENGTFKIRLTKMCEEYPHPEVSELTINVQ